MNFDISSDQVTRRNVNVRTTIAKSDGQAYTEIESSYSGSYLPRKCTSIEPNGDMSILHEYKDGSVVYKEKVNGKWKMVPCESLSSKSTPTLYEECSNIVAKTNIASKKESNTFLGKTFNYLQRMAKKLIK